MSDSRRPEDTDEMRAFAEVLRSASRSVSSDEAERAHERAFARALAATEVSQERADEALDLADHGDFIAALQAAHSPKDLSTERARALVQKALPPPRRGRWRTASFVASGLAAAACMLLFVQGRSAEEPRSIHTALVLEQSRSTEPLVGPVASAGASVRVARIAEARSGDYRKNRFRGWGAQ